MWSDMISALIDLDFKAFNEIVAGTDMLTILKNPYTIAIMVIASIIFIIRGMEKALATLLSVPALVVLFQKTVQGTDALDFDAEKLLIFVGGFVVIAAVNVDIFFVRAK
jgi:hypothetical protein